MKIKHKTGLLLLTLLSIILCLATQTRAMTPERIQIDGVTLHPDKIASDTGGLPVKVFFTLVDEAGLPVPDASLNQSSGIVTVDGLPFLAAVTKSDVPAHVELVLDTSNSIAEDGYFDDMLKAVSEALAVTPENTYLSLREFNQHSKQLQPFTIHRRRFEEAVRNLTVPDNGFSCIYDAVNEALLSLEEQPSEARRAVLLFTDGENKSARNTSCRYSTPDDVEEIIAWARENQIVIYTVRFGIKEDGSVLRKLSTETGGLAPVQANALSEESRAEAFKQIMAALNSQWMAEATVDIKSDGEHSLSLSVSLQSGEEEQVLFPGSAVFETTEIYELLSPWVAITEQEYDHEKQHFMVTIYASHAAQIDCLQLKLRDGETKESKASLPICSPMEEENLHVLPASGLVNDRQYYMELYGRSVSEEEMLPPDGKPGDPLVMREFVYEALPAFKFDFRVDPKEDSGGLLFTFSNWSDIRDDEWLNYEVAVESGGTIQDIGETGTGRINSINESIAVHYYPGPDEVKAGEVAKYRISITLTTQGGRSATQSAEVELRGRTRQSTLAILWESLLEHSWILALIVVVIVLAPVVWVAKTRIEALLPATAVLSDHGLKGGQRSAVPHPTHAGSPWRSSDNRYADPPHGGAGATPAQASPPAASTASPLAASESSAPRAFLKIVSAPDARRVDEVVEVSRVPFRIGREGCELTIGDGRTSREHAVITETDSTFYITDLESVNGTLLGDSDIYLTPGMRWPLNNHARIHLGSTIELEFIAGDGDQEGR